MNSAQVSSAPTRRSMWRSKSPKVSDLGTLLENLAAPALILDRDQKIQCINSALLGLTGFEPSYLLQKSLDHLIQDGARKFNSAIVNQPVAVNRKNHPVLEMACTISQIDPVGEWHLLKLEPIQPELHKNWRDLFLNGVVELVRLANKADVTSALEQAVQTLHNALDLDLIGIYLAESEYPRLRLSTVYDPGLVLPDSLPSSDLIRLSSSLVWFPGKRVSTDLYRHGRLKSCSYLASVPLGQEGAWIGLLVVGDCQSQPMPELIPLLNLIGSMVSTALERNFLISAQQSTIAQQQKTLAIRNFLTENVSEGVFVVDRDLVVLEMNPVAEVMLGYSEKEVVHQPVENILVGSERLNSALNAALQGVAAHDLGQTMLHRRDGQAFPTNIQTIPVEIDGKIQAILILVTDTSEHEQNKIRTQQLEQRAVIGEVIQVFAHEVRNPINNIMLTLEALVAQIQPGDPNLEFVNRIQADCLRLGHLMESILSSSKTNETRFERVDLQILLRKILERWRPRLMKVNVTPFFQVEPNVPAIKGDPRSLEQVFTNLISNAVDAMGKQGGGTLALKVAPLNDFPNLHKVEATVTDNGPGIPDEIKDHIFEPFVSNNPRGTGLGLAITKQIVTAHRGSIKVNTFPGGTMFQVILPAFSEGE